MNLRSRIAATTLGVLVVGFTSSSIASPLYQVLDLGTLGGSQSQANGINNTGQIVGWATALPQAGSTQYPFLWDGTMHGFTAEGQGQAINANAQIVGRHVTNKPPSGSLLAFSSSLGGINQDLSPLQNEFSSQANGINDSGTVVGESFSAPVFGTVSAVSWNGGGSPTFLTPGAAWAVNNSGTIVGESDSPSGFLPGAYPFVWDGSLHIIGTQKGTAYGINKAGDVVGALYENSDGLNHAFLDHVGVVTDLGPGVALSINSAGDIVGQVAASATIAFNGALAYEWINGAAIDLNSLIPADSGWSLSGATGINDKGQIVGWGASPTLSRETHGFLLTPVPLPIAAWLFGSALGALRLARRRNS